MNKKLVLLLTYAAIILPINVYADTLKIIMDNQLNSQIQFGYAFDFKQSPYFISNFESGKSEQDISLGDGMLQYKFSRADYTAWPIGGVSCSIPDSAPTNAVIHVFINKSDRSCKVTL